VVTVVVIVPVPAVVPMVAALVIDARWRRRRADANVVMMVTSDGPLARAHPTPGR